jgi:hypothetical protein
MYSHHLKKVQSKRLKFLMCNSWIRLLSPQSSVDIPPPSGGGWSSLRWWLANHHRKPTNCTWCTPLSSSSPNIHNPAYSFPVMSLPWCPPTPSLAACVVGFTLTAYRYPNPAPLGSSSWLPFLLRRSLDVFHRLAAPPTPVVSVAGFKG